ncbi:hypothetical protein WA158_008005 [Blastocystis sp. Blastoise]
MNVIKSFARNHKLFTSITTVAAASSLGLIDKNNRKAVSESLYGIYRGISIYSSVFYILADYKISFRGLTKGSKAYTDLEHTVNKRSGERLCKTFLKLGGVYIKTGQVLSSMELNLPPEWVEAMVPCQCDVTPIPFEEVSQIFKEDIGIDSKDIFSSIDQTPIGCASLAQVHRATLKTGEEVAVKIQYPFLKKEAQIDIRNADNLFRIIELLFPNFELTWMIPWLKEQTRKEIDFHYEAENGRYSREFFKNRDDIYVPKVYPELSSSRVLVMEYINGIKVNNINGIRFLGLNPQSVARSFVTAMGDMIFLANRIHSDTHPGNVLIRQNPHNPSKHQVVLIDHGQYCYIPREFQYQFALLWQAVILRDKSTVSAICQSLHLGSLEPFLPYMLLEQSGLEDKQIGEKISEDEWKEMETLMEGDYNMEAMLNDMKNMPREMMYMMKILPHITYINNILGNSNRSRLYLLTDSSQKGIDYNKNNHQNLSLYTKIQSTIHFLQLRFKLFYFDIVMHLLKSYLHSSLEKQK